MKINNKKGLIKSIAIPLALGGVSAFLTRGSMEVFEKLNQPPLSPPGWLFPVAWTILYVLMGIASYMVMEAKADPDKIAGAMTVYIWQLVVNFLWPTFFFNFGWYLFSFIWLVLLWFLVLITTLRFYNVSKAAGLLMVPYLLWTTFACYLNLGVWYLNR